ncbi:MAG: helix-turn-helix domain-containing protein, partial [Gemmatimonadota bacterium]|nr:helix-turn-helix domain-containing protein [Gemmatimonadota bacterium]
VAVVDPEHDPTELVELGALGVRRVATWPSGEPPEAWRRNLVDVAYSAVGDVVRRTMNGADPTVAECLAWSTALAHKLPEPAHLAEMTGFSPRKLARHLRRHGGLTAAQTLTLGRVIQALYRLSMTNQSVERVALGVGFASGSGLRRALRRTLGRNPSVYRRRGAVVEAMKGLVSGFDQSGRKDVH